MANHGTTYNYYPQSYCKLSESFFRLRKHTDYQFTGSEAQEEKNRKRNALGFLGFIILTDNENHASEV